MRPPAPAAVLRHFPRSFRGLTQRLVKFGATGVLRLWQRITAHDAPDWSAVGPVILAPNHCSFADPVVLQLASKRHLTFLMTQTVYRIWWARWFFQLWRAVPMPDGGHSTEALKAALQALQEGRSVTIFPEGGVSKDGCLQRGHGGVAWLSQRSGVSVIPVALCGTFEFLPRTAHWPRRGRIQVRFGAPLPPASANQSATEYAATVMDAIHALGAPRRAAP